MNVLVQLIEDRAKHGDQYVDAEGNLYRMVKGNSTGTVYLQTSDGTMLPERMLRALEIRGFRRKEGLTRRSFKVLSGKTTGEEGENV